MVVFRADPFCCLNHKMHQSGRIVDCAVWRDKERFMGVKTSKIDDSVSCAGRSIREIVWEELDVVMERLMSGNQAEDGRDAGRAEGLAFALAIFQNPYLPSVDAVRAEAVERWETANESPESSVSEEE